VEGIKAVTLVLGAIVVYILPTIIASQRRHRSTAGIAIVNLLFGWTVLGWIAAFIWAFGHTGQETD